MSGQGDASTPATGAVVLRVDRSGTISEVNGGATSVLGFGPEGLVGRPLGDVLTERAGGYVELSTAAGGSLHAVAAVTEWGAAGSEWTFVRLPEAIDPGYSVKLRALGDLAHHVVHEINQPLSVMRMAIGTARRKLQQDPAVDAAFVDAKLERLDQQCTRAAAITETLRMFVPRDRDRWVRLSVNRGIDNAVRMASPVFRMRNVVLEPVLDRECEIMGNEMHLEPALLCVLGHVHGRLAAGDEGAAPHVDILSRRDGDEIEIVIEDDAGAGDVDQFDMAKGSSLALGMNLALAQELARELGGRLEIGSTEAGARYRFRFPVAVEAAD